MEKERLLRDALLTCKYRSHVMSKFETVTPTLFRATCEDRQCRMTVDVNLKPMANQIQVGGEAVALTCKGY